MSEWSDSTVRRCKALSEMVCRGMVSGRWASRVEESPSFLLVEPMLDAHVPPDASGYATSPIVQVLAPCGVVAVCSKVILDIRIQMLADGGDAWGDVLERLAPCIVLRSDGGYRIDRSRSESGGWLAAGFDALVARCVDLLPRGADVVRPFLRAAALSDAMGLVVDPEKFPSMFDPDDAIMLSGGPNGVRRWAESTKTASGRSDSLVARFVSSYQSTLGLCSWHVPLRSWKRVYASMPRIILGMDVIGVENRLYYHPLHVSAADMRSAGMPGGEVDGVMDEYGRTHGSQPAADTDLGPEAAATYMTHVLRRGMMGISSSDAFMDDMDAALGRLSSLTDDEADSLLLSDQALAGEVSIEDALLRGHSPDGPLFRPGNRMPRERLRELVLGDAAF